MSGPKKAIVSCCYLAAFWRSLPRGSGCAMETGLKCRLKPLCSDGCSCGRVFPGSFWGPDQNLDLPVCPSLQSNPFNIIFAQVRLLLGQKKGKRNTSSNLPLLNLNSLTGRCGDSESSLFFFFLFGTKLIPVWLSGCCVFSSGGVRTQRQGLHLPRFISMRIAEDYSCSAGSWNPQRALNPIGSRQSLYLALCRSWHLMEMVPVLLESDPVSCSVNCRRNVSSGFQ